MIKSPLRVLLPLLIGLCAVGVPSAMSFAIQDPPPEEVPCSPKQYTGTVTQPICGITVVWAQTKTPGSCPGDPCNFTNFKAVIGSCGDIIEVKFPGDDWETIPGGGPHEFPLPGSLQVICGELATKTIRFRKADLSEGSLQMIFECTPCP